MSRNWLPFAAGTVPVVDVRIGTRRYRALLDTGAQVSLVAPDVALKLGLEEVGFQAIVGITGQSRTGHTVDLPPVGIASMELPSCRATVVELKHLGLKIQFILGVNAFRRLRLQIDFIESRVYILE